MSALTLQKLATGNRLDRWQKDESKLAQEHVEINVWEDNKFDILCQTEVGMLRLALKWTKSINLVDLRTCYSENLGKWVLTVELK